MAKEQPKLDLSASLEDFTRDAPKPSEDQLVGILSDTVHIDRKNLVVKGLTDKLTGIYHQGANGVSLKYLIARRIIEQELSRETEPEVISEIGKLKVINNLDHYEQWVATVASRARYRSLFGSNERSTEEVKGIMAEFYETLKGSDGRGNYYPASRLVHEAVKSLNQDYNRMNPERPEGMSEREYKIRTELTRYWLQKDYLEKMEKSRFPVDTPTLLRDIRHTKERLMSINIKEANAIINNAKKTKLLNLSVEPLLNFFYAFYERVDEKYRTPR